VFCFYCAPRSTFRHRRKFQGTETLKVAKPDTTSAEFATAEWISSEARHKARNQILVNCDGEYRLDRMCLAEA